MSQCVCATDTAPITHKLHHTNWVALSFRSHIHFRNTFWILLNACTRIKDFRGLSTTTIQIFQQKVCDRVETFFRSSFQDLDHILSQNLHPNKWFQTDLLSWNGFSSLVSKYLHKVLENWAQFIRHATKTLLNFVFLWLEKEIHKVCSGNSAVKVCY